VFAVQHEDEHEQEGQEKQYVGTNGLAVHQCRLAEVDEEVDQVGHHVIELFLVQHTGTVHVGQAGAGLVETDLIALQVGQHVRHANVLEHRVVNSEGTARIEVEALQVAVQPVGAAHAGN